MTHQSILRLTASLTTPNNNIRGTDNQSQQSDSTVINLRKLVKLQKKTYLMEHRPKQFPEVSI
jgi:hypothetical protein